MKHQSLVIIVALVLTACGADQQSPQSGQDIKDQVKKELQLRDEAASEYYAEKRIKANLAAAAGTLKSAVHGASKAMQKGAYIDTNKDGAGEYTFIAYMAGKVPPIKGLGWEEDDISLISGQLAQEQDQGEPQQSMDYNFKIYLPHIDGTAIDRAAFDALEDKTTGATLREKYFVCYAWPKDAKSGTAAVAITQAGKVYRCDNIKQPEWNALFSIKSGSTDEIFTSDPDAAWQPYNH